jgi:chemotaxis receptor (MCP) glutamine deamidase CheD
MELNENNIVNISEVKIIKNTDNVVWTILGSCVTVIFKARNDLALFSHSVYPSPKEYTNKCTDFCPRSCFTDFSDAERFRYVSCSLEYMISYLKRNKIDLNSIHTSLIGGASVNPASGTMSTGKRNILKAKEILGRHKIRINRELTGGNDGYTLWYYIKNNQIKYKRHKAREQFVM